MASLRHRRATTARQTGRATRHTRRSAQHSRQRSQLESVCMPARPAVPSPRAWTCSHLSTARKFTAVSTVATGPTTRAVSYTHLRAHETPEHLVCRLLLEKKKQRL